MHSAAECSAPPSQRSEASIPLPLTLSRIPEMPETPVSTELAPLPRPLLPSPSAAATLPPPFASEHQAQSCPRTFTHAEPATYSILPQGALTPLHEHPVPSSSFLFLRLPLELRTASSVTSCEAGHGGHGASFSQCCVLVPLAATRHLPQCSGTVCQMTK